MKIRGYLRICIPIMLMAALLISCNSANDKDMGNGQLNGGNNNAEEPANEPVNQPVPATVCYTANESGSISVIDLETNKVVDSIKTEMRFLISHCNFLDI